MKKRVRIALTVLLLGVFVLSGSVALFYEYNAQKAEENKRAAQEFIEIPEESIPLAPGPIGPIEPLEVILPPAPKAIEDAHAEILEGVDLAGLQEINEDVLGWIYIPNTEISYPFVQGEDNEHYLNYSWDNSYNTAGAIFLEHQSAADFSHYNTIIYGHRMNGGSMFGELHDYAEQDFWAEHPYIYIATAEGNFRYEIFAAYEAGVTSWTYCLDLEKQEHRQSFLDSCMGRSVIETGVSPSLEDSVITLSTCTGRGYDARWVVQARLEGEVSGAEK